MRHTKRQQQNKLWRGIEVVITRRSWKPFVRKGTWVRIPPSPFMTSVIKYLAISYRRFDSESLGEVPKWLKGHPWKGCRSLIAARGFKSLLLRLVFPYDANAEPWQIHSNATLKDSKWIFQRTVTRITTQKNSKPVERLEDAREFWKDKLKHESLILAQDERWRRA